MKLKLLIPLFLSIFVFVVSFFIYININNGNQTLNKISKLDNYSISISIEELSNTNYEFLKTEANDFIEKEKKLFLSQNDFFKENGVQFSITSSIKKENNIESLSIKSSYIQKNYSKLNEKNIYYDVIKNKEILLTDYLETTSDISELSKIVHLDLQRMVIENNISTSEEELSKMSNLSNPQYVDYKLNDDGLQLTYIIKQFQNLKLSIQLSYDQINSYLKSEYQKKIDYSIKRDLTSFKEKKLIAFTFDDGPNTTTTEILLNGLSKYNAKVTFFVLGSKVNSNSTILKRAYEEGNQIGSHTYNHKNLIKLSEAQIKAEINNTASVVKNIIGVEPSVLRPPYGNSNVYVRNNANVPIILWNIDPLDWKYHDKDIVKENIVKNAKDGDIVLVHDIYLSSVEGALLAMEELYKKDFAFVTIDEMMQLKEINWQKGKYYYNF